MNGAGGLLFLNFTNPVQDARSASFRKRIRSHVTTKQHKDRGNRSVSRTKPSSRPNVQERSNVDDQKSACAFEPPRAVDAGTVRYFTVPLDSLERDATMKKTCAYVTTEEVEGGEMETEKAIVEGRSPSRPKRVKSTCNGRDSPAEPKLLEVEYVPRLLEDPIDQLNSYCKRLGETMPNALVASLGQSLTTNMLTHHSIFFRRSST